MTDTTQRSEKKGLVQRFKDRKRMDPVKRRRLMRLGIVVAALAMLIFVPGYFASQPGFMERYPNYESQVEAWQTSVHAKVQCRTCHIGPGVIDQGKHSLQMLGEAYISPVFRGREPDLLGTPVNEACARCHIDLRTVSPEGDLNIPHRAHVDILELDCITCHEFLVHELNPEGTHAPRMESCLECHDGVQAEDACTVCHTEKAAPDDHQDPEWVVVHADKQDEVDCESCHGWTDEWCADCHARKPTSHADPWRSTHRDRVAAQEPRNCEACHDADFCIECHGVVPELNLDPELEPIE